LVFVSGEIQDYGIDIAMSTRFDIDNRNGNATQQLATAWEGLGRAQESGDGW
jgi:hypothetical protein